MTDFQTRTLHGAAGSDAARELGLPSDPDTRKALMAQLEALMFRLRGLHGQSLALGATEEGGQNPNRPFQPFSGESSDDANDPFGAGSGSIQNPTGLGGLGGPETAGQQELAGTPLGSLFGAGGGPAGPAQPTPGLPDMSAVLRRPRGAGRTDRGRTRGVQGRSPRGTTGRA